MSEDILGLLLAFAAGIALGGSYFYGLWLTAWRLARGERPALLLAVSGLCRLAVLLAAFYLVMGGHWERLVACLAGFVLARLVLTRRLGARPRPSVP